MKWLAALLVLACAFAFVAGYGEADGNGRPVWQERANHVLVNAVRISTCFLLLPCAQTHFYFFSFFLLLINKNRSLSV